METTQMTVPANMYIEVLRRAEKAEKLLVAREQADEWKEQPESPPGPGLYLAFWVEDGAWVTEFWTSGFQGEQGERWHWRTVADDSLRPAPIAWRHLPPVPQRYIDLMTESDESEGCSAARD